MQHVCLKKRTRYKNRTKIHLIPLTTISHEKKTLFLYCYTVFILTNRVTCVSVKWLIPRTWIGNKKNSKDARFVYLVKNQLCVRTCRAVIFRQFFFLIKAKYSYCIKTFKVVNWCWIQIKICWLLLHQGVYIYDTIYQINILCQINAKEVLVLTLVLKIFY